MASPKDWEAVRGIAEAFAKQFFQAIQPAAASLGEQALALRKAVEQEVSVHIDAIMQLAGKALLAKQIEELNYALADRAWFVPVLLSEDRVRVLHRAAVTDGNVDGAITQLLAYCDEDLAQQIIDATCSQRGFEKRENLLREAYAAHTQGYYALSIPVILAQAEGAYLDMLETHGIVNAAYLFTKDEWDIASVEEFIGMLPLNELMFASALRGFSTSMCKQVTERVRSSSDLDQLRIQYPNGFLSRHGVLHGRDTDYGTRDNSLRSLFVLDTVRARCLRDVP